MKGKKLLVALREKFSQETTITALGKVVNAEHLLEGIFWTALLTVCIFLTYRDCEPPIRAYLNEATVSFVELIPNTTIQFPGSTLCLNVHLSLLNSKNASRLTDNVTLQRFSDCLHSDECRLYDDFYDEIIATMKLLWSYVVTEVGQKTQIDATNEIAFGVPESFYRFLRQTNLSVGQLIDRVAHALCTKLSFKADTWRQLKNESYDFCLATSPSWFGVSPDTTAPNQNVCFRVDAFTQMLNPEDFHILSFAPEWLYPTVDERGLLEARSEGRLDAYLNFANEPTTTDKSSSYVTIKGQQCTRVEATIAFRVRSLPKSRRPCSTTATPMECLGYCHVVPLREALNCTSVAWRKALALDEQLAPSCFSAYSGAEFADIAYDAKNISSAKECRKKCATNGISCEQTLLTFIARPCDVHGLYQNGSTTIELRVRQFSFVNCEESLSMDFPELVSNLGGVLGLWLEAGLIGIVHLLVFPIVATAEWLLGRRGKGSSSTLNEDDVADPVSTRFSAVESRLLVVEHLLRKSAEDDVREKGRNRRHRSCDVRF